MDSEKYMVDRLQDQISYYNKKSLSYKRKLFSISLISSLCTCSIPIIISIKTYFQAFDIAVIVISQIINLCTWYINFGKLQELSSKYRYSCDLLRKHKVLYENNCAPYTNPENSFSLLVKNCETIMFEENDFGSIGINKNSHEELTL